MKALADAVIKAKPTGSKGTYVQRVAISSTQGQGVKIDPVEPDELVEQPLASEQLRVEQGDLLRLFVCCLPGDTWTRAIRL